MLRAAQLALLGAIVTTAGFLAGRRFPGGSSERADAVLVELRSQRRAIERVSEQLAGLGARDPLPRTPSAPPHTEDPEKLKSIVRSALDEREREAVAEKQAASAPTPENLTAFDRGEKYLAEAISHRRWGPEEQAGLHAAAEGVTPAQAEDLQLEVMKAFNAGKIDLAR